MSKTNKTNTNTNANTHKGNDTMTPEQRLTYWSAHHHLNGVIVNLSVLPSDEELTQCVNSLKIVCDVMFRRANKDRPPVRPSLTHPAPMSATPTPTHDVAGGVKAAGAKVAKPKTDNTPTPPMGDKVCPRCNAMKCRQGESLCPSCLYATSDTTLRDTIASKGKAYVSHLLKQRWTLSSVNDYITDKLEGIDPVPSLDTFMRAVVGAAEIVGIPLSNQVKAKPASALVSATQTAPTAPPVSADKGKVTPGQNPAVAPKPLDESRPDNVAPANTNNPPQFVTMPNGQRIPGQIPADNMLARLGMPVLHALCEYNNVAITSDKKDVIVKALAAKRDSKSAPQTKGKPSANKPNTSSTPVVAPVVAPTQTKPVSSAPVSKPIHNLPVKEKMGADTIRPTQIRILKLLSDGKSRTRQQIADATIDGKKVMAFSDTYWVGSLDEGVNDKNEKIRNVKCLSRHGFVTISTEQLPSDKGGLYEAVVYTITDEGIDYLASL